MGSLSDGLRPKIACSLVLLLLAPFAIAATSPAQDAASTAQNQAQPQSPNPTQTNPGPSQPQALPNSPGAARPQTSGDSQQVSAQQPSPRQQQSQEPVGTAAAESVETTGVAASKPAGAAIAPAKQKRTRSFLIKVSAIVGASVAIGTVVALSSASPSRPPGAR